MSATTDSVLVIDVGTSSVRAARLDRRGALTSLVTRPTPPSTPSDGVVEFDPLLLRDAAIEAARAVLAGGPVDGIGIAVQRASTVVWDRRDGRPLGPGIGWQDLRTVGRCLELGAAGLRLAPNATATKAEWLLAHVDGADRPHAVVGTIDAWLVWSLTGGASFVTEPTNACVTGLVGSDGTWDPDTLDRLDLDEDSLPRIVDTVGPIGEATGLPGSPPITALTGDQQASLVGQGATSPGLAKLTLGTGGMLDLLVQPDRPTTEIVEAGCFPIVAWSEHGRQRPGIEAVMLAAGSHLDWLVEGLGVAGSVAEIGPLAASATDTGGVVFVPALSGLGSPHWDHGARAAWFGLTRGTGRAELARAVLEGIAHRAADLVAAARVAAGAAIDELRLDGGMSRDPFFVSLLASATELPVRVSAEVEATARGGALLAAVGCGWYSSIEASADGARHEPAVEPGPALDRDRWTGSVERASGWHPELSSLRF